MVRSAFTLTEVFVSLAVIGLLMSMIVPAVQNARASARQMECRNHLRQVGVAIHVIQDSKQQVSCDYRVLYHIGMGAPGYDRTAASADNHSIAVFQCPADPNAMTPGSAHSYEMSNGTKYSFEDGYYNPSNSKGECFRQTSEFTDGLSQTVAFSERAIVNEADQLNPRDDPKKYVAWIPNRMTTSGTEQQFVEICRSSSNSISPLRLPLALATGYTHLFTPNTRGCWNNAPVNDPTLAAYIPASSFHAGGVNTLFVDGHVSFISDSVDSAVWKAVGSINGNESVDSQF